MIIEDTKEKLEWRKRAFERELKYTYGIVSWNDITCIHDN